MKNFYSFIHCAVDGYFLKQLYGNHELLNFLWVFEDKYSEFLNYAITVVNKETVPFEEKEAAEFIIEHCIVYLLKKPSDLVSATSKFSSDDNKVVFLRMTMENKMIQKSMLISLIYSESILSLLPLSDEWLSYPLRMYSKHQMDTIEGGLDVADILPDYADIDDLTAQYILSWAYEENRLTDDACEKFKNRYPNKYAMLLDLKKNNET